MKKSFLLLVFIFISLGLFSQENREPEVKIKGHARISMNNGDELSGEASFSFVSPNRINLTQEGQKSEVIRVKDVKEFFIGDNHFVKISPPGISIGGDELVAIRKNPVGYKISIYESISQGIIGTGSGEGIVYKTDRTIYADLPKMKSLIPISDLRLSPFHKKMSAQVDECKELSTKIADKKDGYKVSMITPPEQKMKLFIKIAEEYENCK